MSPPDELLPIFSQLKPPVAGTSKGRVFNASLIPGMDGHRVAIDIQGNPYILLAITGTGGENPPPIRLEHLLVQHGVRCEILGAPETSRDNAFTIVGCIGGDALLHAYFFRTIQALLPTVQEGASVAQVSAAIQKLVELFSSMLQPARKSIQGLWAELLVLAQASDLPEALDAWHPTLTSLHDFEAGPHSVEVKSAAGSARRHHFMLEQLDASEGQEVIVASVLAEPAGAGSSIADLSQELRAALASRPLLVAKLDGLIVATLGAGWRRGIEVRFDRKKGLESLRFYPVHEIPRVPTPVPPEVSGVHFAVDLTNLRPVEVEDLHAKGGLFGCIAPSGTLGRA
jgi:hypothetical protein